MRRFRFRRNVARGGSLKHFPDVHLSQTTIIKQEVPDFDPELEFEYNKRELMLLTEKILLEDPKPPREHPMWLNAPMMRTRTKREIYCSNGVPDPHFVQGLYWRTYPQGRPWKTAEARQAKSNTDSFYD